VLLLFLLCSGFILVAPAFSSIIRVTVQPAGWCVLSLLLSTLLTLSVQAQTAFTSVSAADFRSVLTPDSIAAGFGASLTSQTASATATPLPTTLGGVSVVVRDSAGVERTAGLFFVSPLQINFSVPAQSATGTALVQVRNSTSTIIAQGNVQIAEVAPSVFSINASGTGAPAGLLLRAKTNGQQLYEPLYEFVNNTYVPRTIDTTPNGDRLFLVLFLTGVRRASLEDVQVLVGNLTLSAVYAGAQPGLIGLDQVNAELPAGISGQLPLAISVISYSTSNVTNLSLLNPQQSNTPQINMLNTSLVTAGEEVQINGSNFTAAPENSQVYMVDSEQTLQAQVLEPISNTQLRVLVPFGAATGQLRVGLTSSDATTESLNLRTSVSGFVETSTSGSDRQPLPDVKVRVVGTNLEATTNASGAFVIPNVNTGEVVLQVDSPAGVSPPYPQAPIKVSNVRSARDNQLAQALRMPAPNGTATLVVGGSVAPPEPRAETTARSLSPDDSAAITTATNADPATLEFAVGTQIRFVDGSTTGVLTLTSVDGSRVPYGLPLNRFSGTVVQIAPLGVTFAPGAKLILPNSDNLAPGSRPSLFKLDLSRSSATLGTFVSIGAATVSADGLRVESDAGAITESGYYFASPTRQTSIIAGRVVGADGAPIRRAIVEARGQATFTDSLGGFVLRNVPVVSASGDQVTVEVSFMRPDKAVDRAERRNVPITANSQTTLDSDIVLSSQPNNRIPALLSPSRLDVIAGQARDFDFFAADPDSGQIVDVQLSGNAAAFTTLSNLGSGAYRLRLSPAANGAGRYLLTMTAKDNLGAIARQNVLVIVNALGSQPVAYAQSVVTAEDTARAITLTGFSPSGAALTYTIVSTPLRGALSGNAPSLIYTPSANFTGVDSFTFKVSNGSAESSAATVFISVSPVNDQPVLTVAGVTTVNAGQPMNLTVTATDPDAGQTLTITATGLPAGATFATVSEGSRQLNWTPTFALAGNYQVTFRVTDNGNPSLFAERIVTLTSTAKFAKTSGPQGGQANCFLELPNILGPGILAGTEGGGVFRSLDQGTTWHSLSEGITSTGLIIRDIQNVGATLYAATGGLGITTGGGVYRSTNRGQTWQLFSTTSTGGTLDRVTSLATDGTTLYAGSFTGVWRLNNSTQRWEAFSTGLEPSVGQPIEPVQTIEFHNGILFAGDFFTAHRYDTAQQRWIFATSGLLGGAFTFRSNGTTLFAGGRNGVYRTTNNGANWTAANSGLPASEDALSLEIAGPNLFVAMGDTGVYAANAFATTLQWTPVNTGLTGAARFTRTLKLFNYATFSNGGTSAVLSEGLLLGTEDGIFRTIEAAFVNWRPVSSGLNATIIQGLRIVGNDTYAIASGSETNTSGIVRNRLFRTSDNGQTWTNISNGDLQTENQLRVITSIGTTLYAGGSLGAYVSADRGVTWRRINQGLPSGAIVSALTVAGTTLYGAAGSIVYRLGGTAISPVWTALTALPSGTTAVQSLAAFANQTSTTILAGTAASGLYRSTNGGQSWAVASGIPIGSANIVSLAFNSTAVIAGASGIFGNAYRSTDGGATWAQINHNPALVNVRSLTVFQETIYAGTMTGVFRSANNGQTWTRMADSLLNPFSTAVAASEIKLIAGTRGNAVSIIVDSSQSWLERQNGLTSKSINAVVASGTTYLAGTLGAGISRSLNQGDTWASASSGLPNGANVQALHISPTDSNAYIAAYGDGIYRALPQATGWTNITGNLTNKLVTSIVTRGTTIFAAAVTNPANTTITGGVFRSTNNGQTWTSIVSGLTNRNVLVLYSSGAALFAGTDGGGVYVSTNNGDSWTQASSGLTAQDVKALTVIGANIYAGTLSGGIYRASLSSGVTSLSWTAVNTSLPQSLPVFALQPVGNVLYAGTVYGVFVSANQGASWTQVNAGLDDTYVTSLALSGNTLIAGTRAGGVFISQAR
jgi:uncharacterized protein (TIGR03437 family)